VLLGTPCHKQCQRFLLEPDPQYRNKKINLLFPSLPGGSSSSFSGASSAASTFTDARNFILSISSCSVQAPLEVMPKDQKVI